MSKPAPKFHQRNRHETTRQAAAARANIAKALAKERTLPRTAAQAAASRANIEKAIAANKAHPSAKLLAAEAAWVAKGRAAWLRGEAIWVAKGRAAWARGAALWRLRGEAAWRQHRSRTGVHALRTYSAHPVGSRISPATLRRRLPSPRITGKPTRFAVEISPTPHGRTAWHRARRHHFRVHLREHRPRRPSIGHWRRTRKHVRAR